MDRMFWQSIADNDYAVPTGYSLAVLTSELLIQLGSIERAFREELVYPILDAWISRGYYASNDLSNMAMQLSHNLTKGLGEQGTDTVLLRSYSLLTLTSIIYEDGRQRWLEKSLVKQLLGGALAHLALEKDLRGYDNEKGWLHTIAHSADYLFAFALHPLIEAHDLERIMDAVAAKISEPVAHVYLYSEEERLTRTVIGVLQRDILPLAFFVEWLQQLIHPQGRTALNADFESGELMKIVRSETETCARHNTKQLLCSLYFQLLAPGFAQLSFVHESPSLAPQLLPHVQATLNEILVWC
ncbi:hypothetical protein KSF_022800 [Reticulibacter mediterranei]|uniref:DUF2785 domain-containing protein n=1 Tax=Reticulibacter mediterranei TaxID=2778369 RepID=A0A8J3IIW7_9CHLR|nr:DUF2785 domain-containing protein [Reticulibacter mediterranei]GHO92232.1 hypothetical protein KSF_022800 [Reticulibacter mediterranei]